MEIRRPGEEYANWQAPKETPPAAMAESEAPAEAKVAAPETESSNKVTAVEVINKFKIKGSGVACTSEKELRLKRAAIQSEEKELETALANNNLARVEVNKRHLADWRGNLAELEKKSVVEQLYDLAAAPSVPDLKRTVDIDFEIVWIKEKETGRWQAQSSGQREKTGSVESELAIEDNKQAVAIHNHPFGAILPSEQDLGVSTEFGAWGMKMEDVAPDNAIIGREGVVKYSLVGVQEADRKKFATLFRGLMDKHGAYMKKALGVKSEEEYAELTKNYPTREDTQALLETFSKEFDQLRELGFVLEHKKWGQGGEEMLEDVLKK